MDDQAEPKKDRTEATVQALVELPVRVLERVLGFEKMRYRGLKKN
jgi:hypothetical protein